MDESRKFLQYYKKDGTFYESRLEDRGTVIPGSRNTDAKGAIKSVFGIQFYASFQGLFSVCYSENGEELSLGFGNGTIQIRDAKNGKLLALCRRPTSGTSPITCIRRHPSVSKLYFSADTDGYIYYFTREGGTDTLTKEADNEIYSLDVEGTGCKVLTGGRDLNLRLYDLDSRRVINVYQAAPNTSDIIANELYGHTARINCVKAFPDNPYMFASGGWDSAIRLWDTRLTSGIVRILHGPMISGDAIDIKGFKMATASWTVRNGLDIWDLRTNSKSGTYALKPKSNKGEYLYSCRFLDADSSCSKVFVSGSGINNVQVIDVQKNRVVGVLEGERAVCCLSASGSRVCGGLVDSSIKVAESDQ